MGPKLFCQRPALLTLSISLSSTSISGVEPSRYGFSFRIRRNLVTSIVCTSVLSSMANADATAADCPNTINTGSIRIEPKAIWMEETHTGTSRLVHSSRLGVMLLYEMG
ncbi:MAG: hypothetical protein LUH63_22615 [Parabacteroides sp.]|nr:hypothetical protein [Parabacteroides sp.]